MSLIQAALCAICAAVVLVALLGAVELIRHSGDRRFPR